MCHDDDNDYNDDELFKYFNGHKQRKAQRRQTKDLMPIAWHPTRMDGLVYDRK